MVGLIICIILLIIIGAKDTEQTNKGIERGHYYFDNTDMWREQELFHEFMYKRRRLDGTEIPSDFSYISIWNEVDKQLKKEGLRLSPVTCTLENYEFDDKGYVVNKYKKW